MIKLYKGGTILAGDSFLYAEAMATDGEQILAVGDTDEVLSAIGGRGYETVELEGKTLMAGFVDAHGHFPSMMANEWQCSLRDARSIDEIRERIRAFINERNIQPGEWVRAYAYDENLLAEGRHPTLAETDSICPENPLRIAHKSGHAGILNTMALRHCEITKGTPDPEGGRIMRTEDGEPTGVLFETAYSVLASKVPPIGTERQAEMAERVQDKYASYGITTVQDGYLISKNLEMYHALEAEGRLWVDIFGYVPVGAYSRVCNEWQGRERTEHVNLAGIKTFADGSPQLRTAWLRTPYEGSDECGEPNRTDERMLEGVMLAARSGAQIICHANGDAAIDQFLRSLEAAEAEYPEFKSTRPVIIHAQLMGPDQLPRAKELGAVISFFVAHTYHWGDVHRVNVGERRAASISPVRSALALGIPVTFHQDPPVIEPDMFETIWCAVNRVTRTGVTLGDEHISVKDAIRALTSGGAYQYHAEDRLGILDAGYQADFIIVDRNPLTTPKEELRNIKVEATYKRGRCVYTRQK